MHWMISCIIIFPIIIQTFNVWGTLVGRHTFLLHELIEDCVRFSIAKPPSVVVDTSDRSLTSPQRNILLSSLVSRHWNLIKWNQNANRMFEWDADASLSSPSRACHTTMCVVCFWLNGKHTLRFYWYYSSVVAARELLRRQLRHQRPGRRTILFSREQMIAYQFWINKKSNKYVALAITPAKVDDFIIHYYDSEWQVNGASVWNAICENGRAERNEWT